MLQANASAPKMAIPRYSRSSVARPALAYWFGHAILKAPERSVIVGVFQVIVVASGTARPPLDAIVLLAFGGRVND